MELASLIKQSAGEMGFDLVSICSARPLDEDKERYQSWCRRGFAADLSYLVREHPRRWVPQDLLPDAKSIIIFGVGFFSKTPPLGPKRGFGRVARYAWGKDYHVVVKGRLQEWVKMLGEAAGGSLKTKILVDSSSLLERACANRSGLGFFGKNSLIINRCRGSYMFLSEVLTNLELRSYEGGTADAECGGPCGSCLKCMTDCPAGALHTPRQLDARKCFSYWTIENRGEIPEEMHPRIGDWIFGCDVCQESCPYNDGVQETQWKEFRPESGVGPYISLLELFAIKRDEEFKERFSGTPVLRAKRAGLIRNGCIVAANQKFAEAVPLLRELSQKDEDIFIRQEALRAIGRITNR